MTGRSAADDVVPLLLGAHCYEDAPGGLNRYLADLFDALIDPGQAASSGGGNSRSRPDILHTNSLKTAMYAPLGGWRKCWGFGTSETASPTPVGLRPRAGGNRRSPCLQRLADDPLLRQRLGAAARLRARDFSPARIAPHVMAVYHHALGSDG